MQEEVAPTFRTAPVSVVSVSSNPSQPGYSTNAAPHINSNQSILFTAWQDAKIITRYLWDHSKSICTHLGILILLLSACAGSGSGALAYLDFSDDYCPGGDFTFSYNPWNVEHIFQVNVGFGNFTFTQAKTIDVAWDMIIGRGVQFVLTGICFVVFSKSLNRILEQSNASVSYDAFRAIVFEDSKLSSAFKLAREIGSASEWRSKASILWMVIASIYVVAFPTMVSAMTGYSPKVAPYFNYDGSKEPVSSFFFHRVIFRVNGANRIAGLNLNATYLVGGQGFADFAGSTDPDFDYWACLDGRWVYDDCALAYAFANFACIALGWILPDKKYSLHLIDTSRYDPKSLPTTNSTLFLPNGTGYDVFSPGLIIETFNTAVEYGGRKLYLINDDGEVSSMYKTNIRDDLYTKEQLNANVSCDNQPTYKWGFSFIMLFSFLFITNIWTLGMYAMWIDALCNSKLHRVGRTMGFYRGVIDISNAMRQDILGQPSALAPESRIKEMLNEKWNGGRIAFDRINREELERPRNDLRLPSLRGWTKTWTRLHWLWCTVFTLAGLICFYFPLATAMVYARGMTISLIVFSSTVAVVFCLATVVMLLAGVPRLAHLWHNSSWLSMLPKPWTVNYWRYVSVSAIVGCVAIWAAVAAACSKEDGIAAVRMFNFMFFAACTSAAIFWSVSALMFFTGLFSTLWRWTTQLVRAISRLWRSDGMRFPTKNTPYSPHTTNTTSAG